MPSLVGEKIKKEGNPARYKDEKKEENREAFLPSP